MYVDLNACRITQSPHGFSALTATQLVGWTRMNFDADGRTPAL